MFLPSQATVRVTLEVSEWLALDVLARRAMHHQNDVPPPVPPASVTEVTGTDEDIQRACSVLGEQFIGLLAMMARRQACREAGTKIVVLDGRGNVGLEFEKFLARHLRFPPSHPRYSDAVGGLAQDFRQWVASRPAELASLGLIDNGSDGILVSCTLPASVLSTLPD